MQRHSQEMSPEQVRGGWGDTAAAKAAFSPIPVPHNPADEETQMVQALRNSLAEMKLEFGNSDENVTELGRILDEYVHVQQDGPQQQQQQQPRVVGPNGSIHV
mmetsp:Transcript_3010/g.6361  ORF Transcript_3010/g.6361 Transcript_3010/m.6361 type:complete len:103 (-) Transcript_3010:48-356(-)